MTVRQAQMPRQPSDMAAAIATLQRQVAELKAQRLDLSPADALLPPLDVDSTRWPQTTQAAFTTISSCRNLRWGSQLRLALSTAASGGTTGNVRVMVNGTQWGSTVAAGATFDYTAALPTSIAIGDQYLLTVEAQRTGGAGSVSAQVQLIRAIVT